MADYWVSQNRKYCDFCKCWITDNKPSLDFHEKGRRHQENVKKKLRSISKHSTQSQKDSTKMDATIKQMELAALEAYRKDIDSNSYLASTQINNNIQGASVTKIWNEMKTRDGKTYYQNIVTKETVWTPPSEGYATIEEQRKQSEAKAAKQLKELEKYKQKQALLTMQQVRQEEAEAEARKAREKLKERRVVDDEPVTTCGPLLETGKTDAYGKWQTVKEREFIDLQLPSQDQYYEPFVPIIEPEVPVKEFKEKVVGSLESMSGSNGGETTFKKRKFGNANKRNTRLRLDDD